jgi:nucleoid-associated protein YgaU
MGGTVAPWADGCKHTFGPIGLTANVRSTRLAGVTRTRVRRRRLTLTVLAAGALFWVGSGPVAEAVGPAEGPPPGPRTHVVRPGETLWSIAVRFEPRRDPRETVHAIAVANDVDPGALVPGQRLVVPTPG